LFAGVIAVTGCSKSDGAAAAIPDAATRAGLGAEEAAEAETSLKADGAATAMPDAAPRAATRAGEDDKSCTANADCVPATCCHACDVVNRKHAPSCANTACTPSCGCMDCGQNRAPACVRGKCKIVDTPPPQPF
jgi:hypothetical protein